MDALNCIADILRPLDMLFVVDLDTRRIYFHQPNRVYATINRHFPHGYERLRRLLKLMCLLNKRRLSNARSAHDDNIDFMHWTISFHLWNSQALIVSRLNTESPIWADFGLSLLPWLNKWLLSVRTGVAY